MRNYNKKMKKGKLKKMIKPGKISPRKRMAMSKVKKKKSY
jgi:hypothetical protein